MRVKINEAANFDGAVFGADCFRKNFPALSTDEGVLVKKMAGWWYIWDEKENWIVHDTTFFTKEDFEHLTIIRNRDSNGRFLKEEK